MVLTIGCGCCSYGGSYGGSGDDGGGGVGT